MLYIVALFQPHSLWCFFSCGVATNNIRTEPHPRLEKHADDGHHRKSSVSDFGIKFLGFLSRVRSSQHLESKVSSIRSTSWGLFLWDLAESHVGQDLSPSSRVGILGLSTHINQQSNMLYCHSFSVGLETINCIPVVPHKAVAEVSKRGNLEERLVVVNQGWQSESTDGPKGAWGLLSFSLFLWLSTYLPIFYVSIYLSVYLSIYLSLSFIYLPIYLSI